MSVDLKLQVKLIAKYTHQFALNNNLKSYICDNRKNYG